MGKRILLIDDDVELGRVVELALRPVEVTLHQSFSGMEGLKKAYELHPDLVILDIMMPGMDGFEVCARLREITTTPVLMLTARGNECDMIRGFKVGVDDFVRKPFNKNELEARVRALLRRSNHHEAPEKSHIASYMDSILEIDLASETVRLQGDFVELSPREFGILACLVREQGNLISHHELVREVWGEPYLDGASLSSLYIHYLRKKLQDGKYGHQYIHTLWGRGYWFETRKEEKKLEPAGW
jgi:two-component system KDP operon response regulator KdpE